MIEMTDLDLKDGAYKQLIKLISDKDIEAIKVDIEFEVFRLVKNLKQEQIIKGCVSKGKKIFQNNSILSKSAQRKNKGAITAAQAILGIPGKNVKVRFYPGGSVLGNPELTLNVKTVSTVDQLIEQLQAKRRVSFSS